MEIKYKSVIMPQAEEDISETLAYISEHLSNSTAASNLLNNIIRTVDTIAEFPYSMPLLKDKKITLGKEYRRAEVDNFVLIYKVVEEAKEVRIMAAFYAPSNIIKKLFERQ